MEEEIREVLSPFKDLRKTRRLRKLHSSILMSEAPHPVKFNLERLANSVKMTTDIAIKALEKKNARVFVDKLLKLGKDELEAFNILFRFGFDDVIYNLWKEFDKYFEQSKSKIIKKLEEVLAEK